MVRTGMISLSLERTTDQIMLLPAEIPERLLISLTLKLALVSTGYRPYRHAPP